MLYTSKQFCYNFIYHKKYLFQSFAIEMLQNFKLLHIEVPFTYPGYKLTKMTNDYCILDHYTQQIILSNTKLKNIYYTESLYRIPSKTLYLKIVMNVINQSTYIPSIILFTLILNLTFYYLKKQKYIM